MNRALLILAFFGCACQSRSSSVRFDLSSLTQRLEGVGVDRVVFVATCEDNGGRVQLAPEDGTFADELVLDPRDDDTYAVRVGATCATINFAYVVYRAATGDEASPVAAAMGATTVTIDGGEQDVIFRAVKAGDLELGFAKVAEATACSLFLTRMGELQIAFGQVKPDETRLIPLPTGSYTARCIGGEVAFAEQAFTIGFASRTTLTLQPEETATGLAAALVFGVSPPSGATNGTVWQTFTVQLVDDNGQNVDDSGVQITLASSLPGITGTLVATTVDGVATFDAVSATEPGILSFDLTSPGLTGILGTEITIASKPAASIAFATAPMNATVEATQAITVRVLDADGHKSTDPIMVTLSLGAGGPSGAMCIDCSEQTASGGVASFPAVRIDRVGSYTLVASSPPLLDISAPLTITAGAPARVHFLSVPVGLVTVDDTLSAFDVEVRDQYDNPIMMSGIAVELTTSLSGGSFENGTVNTAANGRATFASTRLNTVGAQTISARLVASPAIVTDNSFGLAPTHGVTAGVRFVNVASTLGAGTAIPMTVEVIDRGGNRVLNNNGTINVYSSDGGDNETFPTELMSGAINGTFTFPTNGARTLHADHATFSDVLPITVIVGPASQLIMTPFGSTPVAGTSQNLHLEVRDGANNIVTDYVGPVTITSTDAGFTPVMHTFSAADFGVHDFTVTLFDAENAPHDIFANATLPTPFNGSLTNIPVDPAAISALVFAPGPTGTIIEDQTFSVTVEARDAFNNLRTQDDASIELELVGATGPTLTNGGPQALSGGVATFALLAVDGPGTGFQLRAHIGGSFPTLSNPFDVLPNPTPVLNALCEDIAVPGLRLAVRGSGFASSAPGTTVSIMGSFPAQLDDYSTSAFSFLVPAGITGVTGAIVLSTAGGSTSPKTVRAGPLQAHAPLLSTLAAISPNLSADGRYVTFISNADLDSYGEGPSSDDVFVTDMLTGVTERVSKNDLNFTGAHGTTGYLVESPSISGDGCRIAFTAVADNLGGFPTSFFKDIYVRDVCTFETFRVTQSYDGSNASNGDSAAPKISADGNFVVFESAATNLVRNDFEGTTDIFVADLRSKFASLPLHIQRVNVRSYMGFRSSIGAAREAAISADGRYVVFVTNSGVVPDPNTCSNGSDQVVWMDRQTFQVRIVSRGTGATGACGNGNSTQPAISADGTKVVFASAADNLDGLSDGAVDNDVFLRDVPLQTTTRLSVNNVGGVINGSSSRPQISADGTYVAFISTAGLLAGGPDSPSTALAYVRRLSPATTTLVSLSNTGTIADADIDELSLSHDGGRVAFGTAAHLNGADNEQDVFVSTAARFECAPPFIYSTEPKNVAQPNTAITVKGYGFTGGVPSGTTCAFTAAPNLVTNAAPNDYSVTVQTALPFDGGGLSCSVDGLTSTPTMAFDKGPSLASAINNTDAASGFSTHPRLGADGTFVVFESTALDFPADGEATSTDGFFRDRLLPRTTTLVSPRLGGGPTGPLGDVKNLDVSYDGRFVVFESTSTDLALDNLFAADTNGVSDVFLYDRALDILTMVSVGPGGQGNSASTSPRISGDGRVVVWESAATNLDGALAPTGGFTQIYARNLELGTTRLISRENNVGANGHCKEPQIDAFATRVIFVSQAPNLPAAQGHMLIYGADVTPPIFSAPQDTNIFVASQASEGSTIPNLPCAKPALSGNGEWLAYVSDATNMGPTGVTGELQIFFQSVSGDPDHITNSVSVGANVEIALDFDGTRVVFSTDSDLLSGGDTNGVSDIYAWTSALGVRRISLAADGSELGSPATDPAISAFGGIVAYCSAENLASSPEVDGNGATDVWITSVSD